MVSVLQIAFIVCCALGVAIIAGTAVVDYIAYRLNQNRNGKRLERALLG